MQPEPPYENRECTLIESGEDWALWRVRSVIGKVKSKPVFVICDLDGRFLNQAGTLKAAKNWLKNW